MHRRSLVLVGAFVIVTAACSQANIDISNVPELPPTTAAEIQEMLATSTEPVLLNVWASWCIPCRSEAPLLREANAQFGEVVRFVGINIRDSQNGARAFIAEFGIDGFDHFFDPPGSVPASLRGFGVPLTFFFAPGGDLVFLQSGVIDERTLALQIDELVRIDG
jgi:thiol-disulfide isomerase/thioredoxin